MGKNEKNLITVNEQEIDTADLNEQQTAILNHINDLDRKLSSAQFNLDQLNVGREAFLNMFIQSLESEDIDEENKEGEDG